MLNNLLSGLHKLLKPVAFGLLVSLSCHVHADDIQDINQMLQKGDLNGALNRANQSLAKSPKDAQLRFLKGLILADQNKTDESIQVFTSITEDYPELPEPYNNLAVLYAAQGKYDAAKNALEMAIRTHPSYATAHENLGDLYAKMASQAYDKALQIDSGNKSAQMKLALIKELITGEPRKAVSTKTASANTSPPVAKPADKAQSTPTNTVATPAPQSAGSSNASDTVEAWAKAWSSQDVDAYLAFYSPDFTPTGMSHTDWMQQRKERLTAPSSISVTVSKLKIQNVSANRAVAKFRQTYQSDKFKNTSSKTLDLQMIDGKWRIIRETGR